MKKNMKYPQVEQNRNLVVIYKRRVWFPSNTTTILNDWPVMERRICYKVQCKFFFLRFGLKKWLNLQLHKLLHCLFLLHIQLFEML